MKIKTLIVSTIAILGIGGLGYTTWYKNHFALNTKINNVSVANLTAKQAAKKLNQTANQRQIILKDKNLTKKINVQTDLTISPQELKPLLKKSHTNKKLVVNASQTKQIDLATKNGTSQLIAWVNQVNLNRKISKPETYKLKNNKLIKIKAQPGNYINVSALKKAINQKKDNISNLNITAEYLGENKVQAKKNQVAANNMKWALQHSLVYKINNHTYKLSPQKYLISGSLKNGGWQINHSKLTTTINKIINKNQTMHKAIKFKTHSGKVITTNTSAESNYGWTADATAETNSIINAWTSKKTTYKASHITGTGYLQAGTKLSDGNYVEVNLTTLYEYVYKNHKLIATIPVMSGLVNSETPTGLFHVLYKQSPSVLRGLNSNGTKYASKVNYWVPITEDGVGLHDSDWQPASVYGNPSARSNYHSHGCINNPPSKMPIIWKYTYTNMPVIIY